MASRSPLVQYASSLPDGQPRSQSPLDEPREDGPSLIKIVASEQHLFDVQAVLAPFLDLVENFGGLHRADHRFPHGTNRR